MTKNELIELRACATRAKIKYQHAAEAARLAASQDTTLQAIDLVEADIEAAKALNDSYNASLAYKKALEEFVQQDAA